MIFRLIPTKYDAENGKSRKCTDTIVEKNQTNLGKNIANNLLE